MPEELSVVIPVYNEGERLVPLVQAIRRELALVALPFRIYVVYDFPEDVTYPFIRRLQEEQDDVEPVLNDVSRGVLGALKKGFQRARGRAVAVVMGDGSDDVADLPLLWRKFQEGADGVCASRYMRGGRQDGGPLLKNFLSRMAGLSLHLLAGLPTHDPTNNFKLYRTDLLRAVSLASHRGFEIALELTVKAHLMKKHVAEVPTIWRDRAAGQSNFHMLRWLPGYLRWYCLAFWGRLFGRSGA